MRSAQRVFVRKRHGNNNPQSFLSRGEQVNNIRVYVQSYGGLLKWSQQAYATAELDKNKVGKAEGDTSHYFSGFFETPNRANLDSFDLSIENEYYNLIQECINSSKIDEALSYVDEAEQILKHKRNTLIYKPILYHFFKDENWKNSKFPYAAFINRALKDEVAADPAVYSIAITHESRLFRTRTCEKLYEEAKRRNALSSVIFNNMVALHLAFSKQINEDRAKEILEEMYESGLYPSILTYNQLLSFYRYKGNFVQLELVIEHVIKSNMKISSNIYVYLIATYWITHNIEKIHTLFEKLADTQQISAKFLSKTLSYLSKNGGEQISFQIFQQYSKKVTIDDVLLTTIVPILEKLNLHSEIIQVLLLAESRRIRVDKGFIEICSRALLHKPELLPQFRSIIANLIVK